MSFSSSSVAVPVRTQRRLLAVQIVLVLVVWLLPVSVHWRNDGLWFQSDAPRHVANGLFWKEFVLSGSTDPVAYALAYYARYPVISPATYPPAFYILEAMVFSIFSPSPYLAKSLVLLFALGASYYLLAWIRRWVSADAGWSAALLPLLPGFVVYSNAIMLNVPATAASIAALYHGRRWVDSSAGAMVQTQLYLAAGFSVLAALIYLPAGIAGCIIAAWLLVGRRCDLLRSARTLLTAVVCVGLLLPWVLVAWRWAPIQASWATESYRQVLIPAHWSFYATRLADIAGVCPLSLALAGLVLGLTNRHWRTEIRFIVIMFVVDYVFLTVLVAREGRYGLLLCVPVICLCAIACDSLSTWISKAGHRWPRVPHVAAAAVGIAVVGAQGLSAMKTELPSVSGMREVVLYLEKLAPEGSVFYEGYYSAVFTFYLQSRDPYFKRRVVVGDKLLYVNAINPMDSYEQFVWSPEEVVRVMKARGGCRYVVVEFGRQAKMIPAGRLVRQAVEGPQFELLRSFPVSGKGLDRIDVYRFKPELSPVDQVELGFPALGRNSRFRIRPIQR